VDVGRDAWPEATAETGRIAACGDGIFAIAMTLVVLDLRPPSPQGMALQFSGGYFSEPMKTPPLLT
jgi:uncharacterized membrane protein